MLIIISSSLRQLTTSVKLNFICYSFYLTTYFIIYPGLPSFLILWIAQWEAKQVLLGFSALTTMSSSVFPQVIKINLSATSQNSFFSLFEHRNTRGKAHRGWARTSHAQFNNLFKHSSFPQAWSQIWFWLSCTCKVILSPGEKSIMNKVKGNTKYNTRLMQLQIRSRY